MKMESPLEVLSRAVSIVQSENKANSQSVAPLVNSDSGIEDDITECPRLSPNTLHIKGSPKRESDADECSRVHPEKLSTDVVCDKKPKLEDPEHQSVLKKLEKSTDHDTHSHHSPGKLLTAVEYLRKCSPKLQESNALSTSPDRSPKQDSDNKCLKSTERLNKAVKYLRESSPRDPDRGKSPESKIDTLEKDHESQQSPERLFNAVRYLQKSPKQSPKLEREKSPCNYKSNEYKRSSPSSVTDDNDQQVKRIKVEQPDEPVTYQTSIPMESHGSKSVSPKRCSSETRLVGKTSIMDSSSTAPVHILPRYLHSYPPYPPLFILTDKPTNYSKLMATYDSIFAPTPPLFPPYLPPAYTKCYCGDKNCTYVSPSPPKYCTPPAYEENSESNEYGLPNVDEHFRKSLGEKYEQIESERVNERPSSVDDHFAKALGQKWYSMDCKKCNT